MDEEEVEEAMEKEIEEEMNKDMVDAVFVLWHLRKGALWQELMAECATHVHQMRRMNLWALDHGKHILQ